MVGLKWVMMSLGLMMTVEADAQRYMARQHLTLGPNAAAPSGQKDPTSCQPLNARDIYFHGAILAMEAYGADVTEAQAKQKVLSLCSATAGTLGCSLIHMSPTTGWVGYAFTNGRMMYDQTDGVWGSFCSPA